MSFADRGRNGVFKRLVFQGLPENYAAFLAHADYPEASNPDFPRPVAPPAVVADLIEAILRALKGNGLSHSQLNASFQTIFGRTADEIFQGPRAPARKTLAQRMDDGEITTGDFPSTHPLYWDSRLPNVMDVEDDNMFAWAMLFSTTGLPDNLAILLAGSVTSEEIVSAAPNGFPRPIVRGSTAAQFLHSYANQVNVSKDSRFDLIEPLFHLIYGDTSANVAARAAKARR